MKPSINPFLCRASLAALGLVFTQVRVSADTTISAWNGGTTTWNTVGNWGGGVPSATISALFDSTFANQPTLGAAQTSQGLWLASGVGQDVTINSATARTLTITGTAVLNSQTAAGIYMNDSANHNLTIGPNTKILLSNSTGFYNQEATGTLTISGDLGLNAKALTIGAGATSTGNVTISGVIYGGNFATGIGAVTVNSAGTVTLGNNNSYTGLTTMTGPGTLILGGTSTSSGFTFAGSNGTVKVNVANGLGSGTINFNQSTTNHQLTLASGSTTATANNLSWNQNGAFASSITLDAPSSQSGYTQTFGTTAFGQQGNLILNQTSNLNSTGTVAFGASTFGSSNSSKNSQLTPNGVNVTIASLAAVASNNQTSTLILDGTSQGNTIGVIADGGSGGTLNKAAITKQNTSIWSFTGTNTYTGATTINGGTLEYKNIGTGITQTLSGALTLAGADATLKSNNAGTGTLSTTFASLTARTAGNTSNFVSAGGTNGSTNIIKFTAGPTASALIDKGLFFNGADYAAYDSTGYLRAFNYTATDTGRLDVNLAADQATLGTTTNTTNVQLRGTGNITALTNSTSGFNTLKISGSHTITLAGQVQGNGILQTGGSSTFTGSNLKVNGTSGEFVIRVDGSSDVLTINSQILANTNSTITKSGDGKLILGGSNTSSSSGTLTINGGIVELNNAGALNSTAGSQMPVAFAAASTGALALNGNSVTVTNLTSNATTPGTATVQNANGSSVANATLTVGNSVNANGTFAGTLKDGTGGGTLSLTKAGTGTLTLTGTNTYTGNTTISAGTISIGSTAALPGWNTNGRYSVANGATLAVYNAVADADIATMLGTTNFAANATLGFDTTSGNRTYTPVVANTTQGDLKLVKIGANSLTLGGTNSYTGGTTIGTSATSGGTLIVNNPAALGGTSAGQVNVVNGTINFAASTASGTGIPTISLSTTTGLLTVNNGVTVNNPLTLGGGGQNIISGPASGTGTVAGAMTWTSGNGLRFDSGGGTLVLDGQITGTDAAQSIMFNRNGPGTIVLGAAANYTGGAAWSGAYGSNTPIGTIFYNGTVKLNAAGALVNKANLTFASVGSTLDLNGNNTTAGWAYNNTGGTVGRFGVITNNAASTTSILTFDVASNNLNYTSLSNSAAYQVLSAAVNDGGSGKVVALVKQGTATQTLINDNSYSGGTTVTAGTLAAYKGSSLGTGNITLNGGTLLIDNNTFATTSGSQTLTDTRSSTVTFGGGDLSFKGRPNNPGGTITGSTTNAGGSSPADGRVLTLTSGNTSGLAVGQAVSGTNISSYIAMIIDSTHVLLNAGSSGSTSGQANTLGAVTNTSAQTFAAAAVNSAATVNVDNNGGGGATLTFNALSGTGNLTKDGSGTLVIDGSSNTYSGTTTVSAGTLQIGNNLALQNSVIDSSGSGFMNVTGFTAPTFGGLADGSGVRNLATLISTGYNNLTGLTLNPGTGVTSTYGGAIADGATGMTVTKTGSGTQTLAGTNAYTGATTIQSGTLVAGANSAVSTNGAFGNASSAIALGNGATTASDAPTLLINGTYTVGRDISVGSVTNTNAYNATIGGSNTSGTSTYTGNITLGTTASAYTATLQAATGGTVEFMTGSWTTNDKAIAIGSAGNTGTVRISNNLTTAGGVNLNHGTLEINGATITGNLVANTSTSIIGTGSIAGNATINGTLSPGNSPGFQSYGGNLTLGGTAIATFELGGTTRSSIALTGINYYDAINVTGALTLDGTINVSWFNGFSAANGDSFNLLDWSTISATGFNMNTDLSLPSLAGGLDWDTSSFLSNGTITVVPEPNVAALLGGMGALVLLRRRRA
jgi:autotransporter-associated beta strand protein